MCFSEDGSLIISCARNMATTVFVWEWRQQLLLWRKDTKSSVPPAVYGCKWNRVEKADGTFLEGFFFHQLYEGGEFKNIVMGPYPLYEVDVDQLVQKTKVTSVLSVQTDMELKQRGIDEVQLKNWYKKNGVRDYQRIPITDDNNSPYAD